jgi:hypothetical protein
VQDLISYRLEVAAANLPAARAEILRQCADWAWSRTGEPAPDLVAEPNGHAEADPDHSLRWWSAELPEEEVAGTELELRHPAWDDPSLEWRVAILLLTRSDRLSLSIQVGRQATAFKLQPALLDFGAPRIIRQIVETHQCFAGVLEISSTAARVGPSEVETTLLTILELTPPDRVLPVVVIDRAGRVDADDVARQLYGLAHVIGLSGFLAHSRLRQVLPEAFAPRNGVRLYWPGFGDSGAKLFHPYWTSERLATLAEPIGSVLFKMLARLSVTRVPMEPLRARLRAAARSLEVEGGGMQGWEEFVTEFDERGTRIDELEAEAEQLRSQGGGVTAELADLRSQLEVARANYRALIAGGYAPQTDAGELESTVVAGPSTWREFVDRLEALEADSESALVINEAARRSARGSDYPDPERIFKHLEMLSVAASDYRSCSGEVGAALKDWLRDTHGLQCAPHDSKLRAKEYAGKRDWSKVWHVKVDDAKHGAVNVGRIYFEPISAPGPARFEVWHVGSKLVP